jgi:hypothetical protein
VVVYCIRYAQGVCTRGPVGQMKANDAGSALTFSASALLDEPRHGVDSRRRHASRTSFSTSSRQRCLHGVHLLLDVRY